MHPVVAGAQFRDGRTVRDRHTGLFHRGEQHPVQVRPVHCQRGQPVPDPDAARHVDQRRPVGIAEPVAVKRKSGGQTVLEHAQLTQAAQRVRGQHQADAQRRVRRLAFDNVHIDAVLREGGRRAQAADPRTDHEYRHGALRSDPGVVRTAGRYHPVPPVRVHRPRLTRPGGHADLRGDARAEPGDHSPRAVP